MPTQHEAPHPEPAASDGSRAAQAKARLNQLFDDLLAHDGYSDLSVEIRILKRGQKEVVIRCGKQYRYVIDSPSG